MIVGRTVGVDVGNRVFLTTGVRVGGVVVGRAVLITNKSGVNVEGRLKGVAVGCGGLVEVGGCKNGSGNAVHPARSEMMTATNTTRFMKHLRNSG